MGILRQLGDRSLLLLFVPTQDFGSLMLRKKRCFFLIYFSTANLGFLQTSHLLSWCVLPTNQFLRVWCFILFCFCPQTGCSSPVDGHKSISHHFETTGKPRFVAIYRGMGSFSGDAKWIFRPSTLPAVFPCQVSVQSWDREYRGCLGWFGCRVGVDQRAVIHWDDRWKPPNIFDILIFQR